MSISTLLTQLLNGLAISMLLFLLAAGLSLIFGMMDVLNLAHGSLYMIGGYLGLALVRGGLLTFWWALLVVPLMVAAMGIIIEAGLLRRLYHRTHLDQVLLTLGLAFVTMDAVRWLWTADVLAFPAPKGLNHSIAFAGQSFPAYRLFVIAMGLTTALLLWLLLNRTRLGAAVRAGVSDKEMVTGLGIDIHTVFTMVFALGAGLAGLAGVVAGPMLGLNPGMDFDTLISTLIVVVTGGMGTISGAFWGSLLVGLTQTMGILFMPKTALFLIYALMAGVLLWRPGGLFGRGVHE